ncbi:hypothetical protein B0J14DRAFT_627313 [Halenospora varia]|nr:hypothetical protein B0J14DRAFT_627313 [Halenospora varia]
MIASIISFADTNSGFQARIINGPVHTKFHHHATSERLETPPNPSIVIPFSRDTDFVKQGMILDQIHQKCAVSGSQTALVGLGGMGKSQLAIKYAYQTQDLSPETWQSFQDITNCVKISRQQNPQANIFQLGKWVLILDNVDDAGFLCPNRSILITTWSEDKALNLVKQHDIITIKPISRADALTLFKNKLGGHDDGSDNGDVTTKLLVALEFMPLAIVQAATYISWRKLRYSVQEYLQDFRESNRKRTSLLDYNSKQLRQDREAKNSIIIRPSATDLLSLISFFDRQGIPDALLQNQSKQIKSRQDQREITVSNCVDNNTGYSDDNKDSISQSILQNYLFISVNTDGITFKMHGLVQLATRKWLEVHGQIEKWKQQFIKNLDTELPTGEYKNWERSQKPKEQDLLIDWTLILYKAVWYALRIGNRVDTEKMILGQEHNKTLNSMGLVGLAYTLRGRWDATKELFVQVMETRKKKLGADHPDTLTSMANLASTFWNQGRWDAAKELDMQVMETRKKKLGADHPDTLTSMANLASTYRNQGRMANLASTFWNQGRWDAAKELDVQVMETSKKKLGADHPDTLTSMANLASTYRNQGRWDAAEELDVQVIETSKKKLGADHLDTLTSMANLASTFWNQGRWDAAEELEVQVMKTSKKKLGADHPDTLNRTGKETEAIRLIEECIQLRKRVLGPNHPHSISSCIALDI